jgi:DNA-directed RNA polymerase subunit H (RpoH/RPB5)
MTTESVSSHTEESKGVDITINTGVLNNTRWVESKTETDSSLWEEKKDKEKTINDINNFLIESYKIKIDKILTNLNISIERITNNDPVAQAKLLEKIRGDISVKIEIINSRTISENRKKILSSVFSYIQENLDAKISKLVGQK